MTDTQRRLFIIVLTVLLVGGVGLVIYNIVSRNNASDTVLKDKDTGESIDLSPEAQASTGGDSEATSKVILFGLADTIKKVRDGNDKTTGSFITSVRDAIWSYSLTRTNDAFPTITILPAELKLEGNTITSRIRLGQDSAKFASIRIELSNERKSAIVTIDDQSQLNEYKGKFVYVGGLESPSPLFEIGQKNTTSTDLIVEAIEGNREGALNHLVSAGYNVSDFNIEFTHYERPSL